METHLIIRSDKPHRQIRKLAKTKEGVLFSGGVKVEENEEDIREVGNGGNECTIKSGIILGGLERLLSTLHPTFF